MRGGRIVEAGHTTRVLSVLSRNTRRALLAAVPRVDDRRQHRGRPQGRSSCRAVVEDLGAARPLSLPRHAVPTRAGKYLRAVDGVDLAVRPGEAVGIVGESRVRANPPRTRGVAACESPLAGSVVGSASPSRCRRRTKSSSRRDLAARFSGSARQPRPSHDGAPRSLLSRSAYIVAISMRQRARRSSSRHASRG